MDFLCFGHRGARGHAAENTLGGIERGLALGATWIEIDVHLSADGRPVVIHDRRLERCTDGHGLVAQTPWSVLRTLDAGGGEHIPLLDEVMECLAGRGGLNVELKGPGAADTVVRVLRRWLARGAWTPEMLLLSSFDHPQLDAVRRQVPELPLGALVAGVPLDGAAVAQDLSAVSIHLSLDFLNAALVDDAHRRGLKVYVYTVNEPDDIAWCRALGVDGVFSDYPERVVGVA